MNKLTLLQALLKRGDFKNLICLCSFELDGNIEMLPGFRESLSQMLPSITTITISRDSTGDTNHGSNLFVTLTAHKSITATFILPDHVYIDTLAAIERTMRDTMAGNRLRRPDGVSANYNDLVMASIMKSCSEDDIDSDFCDFLIDQKSFTLSISEHGVSVAGYDNQDKGFSGDTSSGERIYRDRVSITSLDPVENPLIFSPYTGVRFDTDKRTAESVRTVNPLGVWRYNPWTGESRSSDEILTDPVGCNLNGGAAETESHNAVG